MYIFTIISRIISPKCIICLTILYVDSTFYFFFAINKTSAVRICVRKIQTKHTEHSSIVAFL